jgi:hypothetical protein
MTPTVKSLFWTLAICGSLVLSACVFIRSSAISEVSGSGTPVNVDHSDYGILYLTAPASLTSDANADLARQCQSGHVTDVQTQLSVRDWFAIVQYYRVTANGVCKP